VRRSSAEKMEIIRLVGAVGPPARLFTHEEA